MSDQASPRPDDSSGFAGHMVRRVRSTLANGIASLTTGSGSRANTQCRDETCPRADPERRAWIYRLTGHNRCSVSTRWHRLRRTWTRPGATMIARLMRWASSNGGSERARRRAAMKPD
jgi:hypothetical protein